MSSTSRPPIMVALGACFLSLLPDLVVRAEVPSSQEVSLHTNDGFVLTCELFPAEAANTETAPVILIHGYSGPRKSGSRHDFDALAVKLQSSGMTVIAPDLRGFGESIRRSTVTGATVTLRYQQLGPADLLNMVRHDIETVKRYLLDLHDQRQLNIELLAVVGADLGAAVAVNWARVDWSWPVLPNLKQGQDVKTLVLISPLQQYRNLSVRKPLTSRPLMGMPIMIVYGGKGDTVPREVARLQKAIDHLYPQTTEPELARLRVEQQNTSLQGTHLLDAALPTSDQIRDFLVNRTEALNPAFPWRPRSSVSE